MDALVDWERRDRGAMRVGLEPVLDLARRLGNPHERFRAVHVAGSKGKGSVSSLVAAGLARAGARTGVYASPHVERPNERVRVEGAEVEDAVLAAALERALEARERGRAEGTPAQDATWFDVFTAAGFAILSEAEVDWAVVECGLGGRLDSTNILRGEVCVVTNVYLEHAAILGGTRAAIAREKALIVEPGAVLVTGVARDDREARPVLESVALGREAALVGPPEWGRSPSIEGRNAALAAMVLDVLAERGVGRGKELLDAETIAAARLPGRSERCLAGEVPVVLDGAHVSESVELLLADLARDPALAGRPEVVLALGSDKDALGVLKALRGRVDRVTCTGVAHGPPSSPEALAREALGIGLDVRVAKVPEEAFRMALRDVREGGWLLCTGSLYLAGAIRPHVGPWSPRC